MGLNLLPGEICSLILNSLERHNLWAICLVCRRWNIKFSPILYETVIVDLRFGVSLTPGFLKSFILNPRRHSKIHLIRNICLLSKYDKARAWQRFNKSLEWKWGVEDVVNEILFSFLQKLQAGQLKAFIWRSDLTMDGRFLNYLAEHQSSLECLYLLRLKEEHGLGQTPIMEKLTSLRSLRWGDLRNADDVGAFISMLRGSEITLESLSLSIDKSPTGGGSSALAAFEELEKIGYGTLELSSLVEYQTPNGPMPLGVIVPVSRIRRVYVTMDGSEESSVMTRFEKETWGMTELQPFSKLVEINMPYFSRLPEGWKDVVFHNRSTLRILSLCWVQGIAYEYLTPEKLLELGRGCPDLVELAISLYYCSKTDDPEEEEVAYMRPLTTFPINAFPRLEFLFVSIPEFGNEAFLKEDYVAQNHTAVHETVKNRLEVMLNGTSDGTDTGADDGLLGSPNPSTNLRILAIGLARPEIDSCVMKAYDSDPVLWTTRYSAIHQAIKLSPTTLPDAFEVLPNLKLLRRYPQLVPNEGLRNILRNPHLPPYHRVDKVAEERRMAEEGSLPYRPRAIYL